jgi:hypothetical protein
MGDHARDGRAEATETLHRYVGELCRSSARGRGRRSKRTPSPGDEQVPARV